MVVLLGTLASVRPAQGLAGAWGVTFAIDAPWRLEPQPDGTFGQIPIIVTFRQASNELGREFGFTMRKATGADSDIWVGDLTEVQVVEWVAEGPRDSQRITKIAATQLREVELKREMSTKAREPDHRICRPFAEPCPGFFSITATDEWHGMLWYAPKSQVTPGQNIHLEVTAVTVSGGNHRKEWTASLVVHAGEAPLPRFGASWLYGDLHYHSQMTGNEGEYGYSYRNVARALGSLGLDFVFATDHASNGEQTLGNVTVPHCGTPDGLTCTIKDREHPTSNANKCADGTLCYAFMTKAARDLNASRFAVAKKLIYGPGGADDAVAKDAQFGFGRLRSSGVLPQVYMGEEVDAQPEISNQEYEEGVLHYGDRSTYQWPNVSNCLLTDGGSRTAPRVRPSCRETYARRPTPRDHRSYVVQDREGYGAEEHAAALFDNGLVKSAAEVVTHAVLELDPSLRDQLDSIVAPARQHIVYFPGDGTAGPGGWVSSDTTRFGGGGRRLLDVLNDIGARGYAFLAHPLSSSSPGGQGPDVVPYSDLALDRAWASPAVLGLEFWNEAFNRKAVPTPETSNLMKDEDHEHFTLLAPFRLPTSRTTTFPWHWPSHVGIPATQKLYEGAFTWDRYLRKGLDPKFTTGLGWLPSGEPRKWFTAGGSDAHGDFNYRQLGQVCESRWCVDGIIDTAVGRPRNLVMVSGAPAGASLPDLPTAKRYTNGQVINALRSGQFAMTNGPAIRIVVDRNRNGTIDDGDFTMGSTFNFYPGEHIPLLVEWFSTKEFGPVGGIDLYVGNSKVTYAPRNHGPVVGPLDGGGYGSYGHDPSGILAVSLTDADGRYNKVAGSKSDARYHGIAQINLGPAQFGLASADQALFYVRALAKTVSAFQAAQVGDCPSALVAGSSCGDGIAYSNPIWGRYNQKCPTPNPDHTAPRPFLDGDANDQADVCERDLPDPCGQTPAGDPLRPPRSGGSGPASPSNVSGAAKPIPAHSCQTVRSLMPVSLGGGAGPASRPARAPVR